MTVDREAEIRKRAQEIWESEGRPEGRDLQHWEQAKAEIENGTMASIAGEGQSIPLGLGVTDVPKNKEINRKKASPVPVTRRAAKR